MYAARKLKVKDFESWIDLELTGYKSNNVPSYRIFESEKKYWEDVVFPSKNKKGLRGSVWVQSGVFG